MCLLHRGPVEIKFLQEFDIDLEVKLALTAWAKASFDVLHSCASSGLLNQTAKPQEADNQDTEMSTS